MDYSDGGPEGGGEPALQRRPLRIVLQREVVDDALGGAEDDLQRRVEIAVANGSTGANVRRHGRRAVLQMLGQLFVLRLASLARMKARMSSAMSSSVVHCLL